MRRERISLMTISSTDRRHALRRLCRLRQEGSGIKWTVFPTSPWIWRDGKLTADIARPELVETLRGVIEDCGFDVTGVAG
jgi:hypothetical protein